MCHYISQGKVKADKGKRRCQTELPMMHREFTAPVETHHTERNHVQAIMLIPELGTVQWWLF